MCRFRPGARRASELLDFPSCSARIPVLPVSTAVEARRERLIAAPAESHRRLSGRGIFLLSTLTSPRFARLRQGPSPSGKQENSLAAKRGAAFDKVPDQSLTVSFGALNPSLSQEHKNDREKGKAQPHIRQAQCKSPPGRAAPNGWIESKYGVEPV